MITRYALFKGRLLSGKEQAFKKAVLEELLPTWQVYPRAVDVRVSFATSKDTHAPDIPLILAVDFPTEADLNSALESKERLASRAATQRVLPGLFEGEILHYVTSSESYPTT
jgi:hypothetical protein